MQSIDWHKGIIRPVACRTYMMNKPLLQPITFTAIVNHATREYINFFHLDNLTSSRDFKVIHKYIHNPYQLQPLICILKFVLSYFPNTYSFSPKNQNNRHSLTSNSLSYSLGSDSWAASSCRSLGYPASRARPCSPRMDTPLPPLDPPPPRPRPHPALPRCYYHCYCYPRRVWDSAAPRAWRGWTCGGSAWVSSAGRSRCCASSVAASPPRRSGSPSPGCCPGGLCV